MGRASKIRVEVVYALPDRQMLLEAEVEAGATVAHAVVRSGILERHPEIDLERNAVGIFGRVVRPDAVLRDRDRIEIYRPLLTDPKEARRRRAKRRAAVRPGR